MGPSVASFLIKVEVLFRGDFRLIFRSILTGAGGRGHSSLSLFEACKDLQHGVPGSASRPAPSFGGAANLRATPPAAGPLMEAGACWLLAAGCWLLAGSLVVG